METKKTFADLGLSAAIVAALEKKNFKHPTPIQEQAIPQILASDQDVLAQAQTGTGKTAAFGLPLIEKISIGNKRPKAIIITPTRELTVQVSKELNELKGDKGLNIVPIYGGTSIDKQSRQLHRGCDVLVGTPGRVFDHMRQGNLHMDEVTYLVLDEADEMLNGGFIEDIEQLLRATPEEKQLLLFSATMPQTVINLAKTYMDNPARITIERKQSEESLTEQLFVECHRDNKLPVLCRIIDSMEGFYGLIFCRTKRDVDELCDKLIQKGYPSEAMHGDLSQHQRELVLKKFRRKQSHILVVSDVAARGIDIEGLTHVVNYSLPFDSESYTHRIGRTGRAGNTGQAISIIEPSEFRRIKWMERMTKKRIEKMQIPSVDDILARKQAEIKSSIVSKMTDDNQSWSDFADELLEEQSPKRVVMGMLAALVPSVAGSKYEISDRPSKGGGGRKRDRDGRGRGGKGKFHGRGNRNSHGGFEGKGSGKKKRFRR